MGKGQRARAERAAEKEALKPIIEKKAKKTRIKKIVISVVAIVLVVALVGSLIYNAIYSAAFNSGKIQRNTTILESEHYTVDAAMMSYLFYTEYNDFLNNYSSYLSYFGLDTSKSLKRQDCMMETGSTWFEYFSGLAGDKAKELLYLAENAHKEKMTLNEDDQKNIQQGIDSIYEAAKSNGMANEKFLSAAFGTGVKESDVRKCMELSAMAQKYLDKYTESLIYTDADLQKYYEDNIDSFRYVDYYSYIVSASDTADSKTYPAAKVKADALAAVKSTDAFAKWVESDFLAGHPVTAEYTAEKQKEELSAATSSLAKTKVLYAEEDEGSKWLFKTAKVGETYVYDDKAGNYTVYYCTATPYRDETLTRTIRDIVLTEGTYEKDKVKDKANELFEAMKKEGLTEETFKKYCSEYSENTASNTNGGLCENYKESSFEGNIGRWTYSADRKVGDFEVVQIDGGYALCYYVGEGIAAWKADCTNDKKNSDYNAAMEVWKKEITLTENEKGYNKIPDIA